MRRCAAVLLLFSLIPCVSLGADEANLDGYSLRSSQTERDWEKKFRSIPDPANLRAYMQRLSARPHHVGSPYDKDNAEWILARFKEWGLDAHIETFDVLFPTPKVRVLEMVEPTKFTAKLEEPAIAIDPTSNQKSEQLPTYNAYSTDGDVTAPLVFVNYGQPEDYEKLDRLGISVKGAIVIAKYYHSWRGVKPKVAAEHGAIGCLIYSEPRDDGYGIDDVFPQGPMRNPNGVQRGSVMDFASNSPGDPLTPGYVASPEHKRLSLKEAKSITTIPVLPISYGDAQPLLAALKGPMAPEDWRGSLPIPYHVGPGPARVHLKLEFNWDLKPVNDVIAKIPGSVAPDEWIIRGNHHDGWVNGAEDPISGQAPLLEEARALGALLKQGWKPRRTIIYAAWDGEEPMLLGSTEWVEAHADELRQHAAVYINTDGNDRGLLNASGSHTLEKFINGVARDIEDPETNMSVWQRLQLSRISQAKSADDRKELRQRGDLRIDALGSGSDYTGFIDHIGIASLDLSYEGEVDQGVYHSIYDDFYWYTHFSDTDFVYGRALSQTVGTSVMRLADAEVLPFDYIDLADTVQTYTKELEKLLSDKQEEIRERNQELDEGVFKATYDPKRPTVAPPREEIPPYLDFAPMHNALDALTRSADRYRKTLSQKQASLADSKADMLLTLNARLIESERKLTNDDGLPRRPWFKHLLYAPGVYTGYGVKTIPGVREGIEQKRYDEANREIVRVAKALDAESALIDEARQILEKLGP
ncbi:MAG TPA: transferrin receptor-like dimerization domain-containing protein [Candidatus Sulfotelmatobacter sp.]|jgi:N-acetylated-alpha-linked acidic dipeptidase|nr:transferrin receptor-like dimerization domain-containing protein [Candidatus Sulfotelmatobacter sp.]